MRSPALGEPEEGAKRKTLPASQKSDFQLQIVDERRRMSDCLQPRGDFPIERRVTRLSQYIRTQRRTSRHRTTGTFHLRNHHDARSLVSVVHVNRGTI
jgi:hypothetical protein